MKKSLTTVQLKALLYAGTHKGFVSDTRSGVPRATLKALEAMGLLKYQGATEWRHGEGNRVQYKVTPAGRELICIGRMFRAFQKEAS